MGCVVDDCSCDCGSSEMLKALDLDPERSSPLPERNELTPESDRSSGKRDTAVPAASSILNGEDLDKGPSSSTLLHSGADVITGGPASS